jgi:hypothetical protein
LETHFLKNFRWHCAAKMFALFLFINVTPGFSQQLSNEIFIVKAGAFAGYNWNSHSADFKELPGVESCCPIFENGSGTGTNTGLSFELQHYSGFSFGLRAGYSGQFAVLKGAQEIDVIVGDSAVRPGTFENSISANFATVGLEPFLMYNPVSRFHILAGIRLGLAITREYSQREVIIEPQSGVFKENGRRVRNERSGEIPEANIFQAAMLFGATHEFPLNNAGTLFLAPEVILQIALTDIMSGAEWKPNTLRAGLALKYLL